MKNARIKTTFYLDLKHVHKYGSAKFQPNPIFSSQQMATESAESVAEEKKKKKSRQPLKGIPSEDGMPQLTVMKHVWKKLNSIIRWRPKT